MPDPSSASSSVNQASGCPSESDGVTPPCKCVTTGIGLLGALVAGREGFEWRAGRGLLLGLANMIVGSTGKMCSPSSLIHVVHAYVLAADRFEGRSGRRERRPNIRRLIGLGEIGLAAVREDLGGGKSGRQELLLNRLVGDGVVGCAASRVIGDEDGRFGQLVHELGNRRRDPAARRRDFLSAPAPSSCTCM